MSQKNFAITPSVSISRSKFRRPSQHKTSFNLGAIVPIYVDADILPGDTVSLDLASLIRMSTPMAPLMDNIFVDYYAFFVPNRLVWKNWKKFMGENTVSYGAATEPTMPYENIQNLSKGKLGDYFGLPVGLARDELADDSLNVSALPSRAYALIYNEWFRDQNLIAPVVIPDGDGSAGSYEYGDGATGIFCDLFTAAKESDYFTRCLPYAQKGSPVSLPLGGNAPLTIGDSYKLIQPTGDPDYVAPSIFDQVDIISGDTAPVVEIAGDASVASYSTLYADLSKVTAATINQLRFAFQYQKFLEKDALYGTRYWEILKGHFGITAPDASLQRPELLGHFRQHINIDQVLQTSESGSTPLGNPGANSVSGKSEHLISKSFVEHGILMILAVARHDQTYGQGINRMWSRKHRTDYYFPVFANLGAQEVKLKELFAQGYDSDAGVGHKTDNESIFGYQEAWAEYRYKPSLVTADLNPAVSESLAFWTLANRFGSKPTLSKDFIEQDRTAIQDALVSGENGPDFIADFFFDATYVRPMPMYSLPGLIDHH